MMTATSVGNEGGGAGCWSYCRCSGLLRHRPILRARSNMCLVAAGLRARLGPKRTCCRMNANDKAACLPQPASGPIYPVVDFGPAVLVRFLPRMVGMPSRSEIVTHPSRTGTHRSRGAARRPVFECQTVDMDLP